MDERFGLSLAEAVRRLSSGEMSSEAYTRALLERVNALEERVLAWQTLDRERALGLAREADRRMQAGRTPGALHGVPIAVKDIIDVRGMPSTMGSPCMNATSRK